MDSQENLAAVEVLLTLYVSTIQEIVTLEPSVDNPAASTHNRAQAPISLFTKGHHV